MDKSNPDMQHKRSSGVLRVISRRSLFSRVIIDFVGSLLSLLNCDSSNIEDPKRFCGRNNSILVTVFDWNEEDEIEKAIPREVLFLKRKR